MKYGDITRVTGVPELTWCYNRNTESLSNNRLTCEISWKDLGANQGPAGLPS